MARETTIAGMTFIRWFDEITIDDVPLMGGKNASLGEMVRELRPKGVRLADGFAVTADAYRDFLRRTGVDKQIERIMADLDTRDVANLQDRGRRVRQAILAAELPVELREEIGAAYAKLSGSEADVDVDSLSESVALPLGLVSGFFAFSSR